MAHKSVKDVVKREGMRSTEAVGQRRCSVPIIVVRTGMLIRLLARGVKALRITQPIILILRSIDVIGRIAVVVCCKRKVEALGKEVALRVLHRRHQRVATT